MAQNYTRQSTFADGDTITAALFNDEYNQLVNTFNYSATDSSATGHRHDGTAGEGGNIYRIGDLNFFNKIEADSVNNRWGVFVEVGGSAVEQVRIQDGAVVPVTNNDVDLGSASFQFKNLYIDGTANIDSLVADTADINGGTVDNVAIGASTPSTGNFSTLSINSVTVSATATELNTLDGITATTAELNILDGVTATATELNTLDGITVTTAELNALSGLTATSTELNTLDGITATTSELNVLDGITASTSELNTLDGITATASELNTLDGITATTSELNILDGVTASTAELNYLDITSLGTSQASKAVTADSAGDVYLSEELKAKSYNETVSTITSSGGSATLNCESGNLFVHELTENVTYTFSNPPANGTGFGFTLKVTQDTVARTITWPASVKWGQNLAPTISTNSGEIDIFTFFTHDGGSNWYGFAAGQDMS